MEEKILNTRKNGMAMLLLTLLGYGYLLPCSFSASRCSMQIGHTGCFWAFRC